MAVLEILQIPDPRLKKPSRTVKHVDEKLKKFLEDMDETLCFHDGVGLAAVQVGAHKRICLIRIPKLVEEEISTEEAMAILESDDEEAKRGIFVLEEELEEDSEEEPEIIGYLRRKIVWSDSKVLINPRIVEKEGAIIDDEGCLSDAGFQAKVERCRRVVVTAQDIDMNPVKIEATGLEARALQHEIDHLDGIIYHDRMIEDTRGPMGGEDDEDNVDEEGEELFDDENSESEGDISGKTRS